MRERGCTKIMMESVFYLDLAMFGEARLIGQGGDCCNA